MVGYLYCILDVSKNATTRQLKLARDKLAKQYHPDKAEDQQVAEEMMAEINQAYRILSKPSLRAKYDSFGLEAALEMEINEREKENLQEEKQKKEEKKKNTKKQAKKRAEEKRAKEKRAEEKRAEEKRAEEKRAEETRAEEKRAEWERAHEKRAEEKKAEEKNADDKAEEDKKRDSYKDVYHIEKQQENLSKERKKLKREWTKLKDEQAQFEKKKKKLKKTEKHLLELKRQLENMAKKVNQKSKVYVVDSDDDDFIDSASSHYNDNKTEDTRVKGNSAVEEIVDIKDKTKMNLGDGEANEHTDGSSDKKYEKMSEKLEETKGMSDLKVFSCTACGEVFNSSATYFRHKKAKHGVGKLYVCSVCGKVFFRSDLLKKHCTNYHTK